MDAAGQNRTSEAAAEVACDALPTEYVDGEWRLPTHESDPLAVVAFATEPSPETGHVGWCWWALGAMGDANSYSEACRAAEASLRTRAEPRHA